MTHFLVVLDTMWGAAGRAPRWFHINPRNHSGRRLLSLTGATPHKLWITNACPQSVNRANQHGTPSPQWLAASLCALPRPNLCRVPLLVCGAVARRTFDRINARTSHVGPVYYMLHPAARTWTKASLERARHEIATLL